MTYPTDSSSPDTHHYPPSTADWVTSPLSSEDELPPNPLESVNRGIPELRLGALLVILGGLLAIAGSVMQLAAMIHQVPWYLWLVLITDCLALGAVGGSLTALYRAAAKGRARVVAFTFAAACAQIVEIVVLLTAKSVPGVSGAGIWVAVASTLILLVGGLIQQRAGHSRVSSQDQVDQADSDARMKEFNRAGKFFGIPFGPRATPL